MATLRFIPLRAENINLHLEQVQSSLLLSAKVNLMYPLPELISPDYGSQGMPRDKINTPISPISDPTDKVLFENPENPDKKSYLPRYKMRNQDGRYEIGLVYGQDGKWHLSVGLERFPAPELGNSVQGTAMLPHEIEASLHYYAGSSYAIKKTIIFNESADDEKGGVTISVGLDLEERDALLYALQTQAADPRLVISRTINVAIESEAQGLIADPMLTARQLREKKVSNRLERLSKGKLLKMHTMRAQSALSDVQKPSIVTTAIFQKKEPEVDVTKLASLASIPRISKKILNVASEVNPAKISLDKNKYLPGEKIMITLEAATGDNHTVHLCKSSAPYNGSDHMWGSDLPTSNPFSINAPAEPGVYQVRLHSVKYGFTESNLVTASVFYVGSYSSPQPPESDTRLYQTVLLALENIATPNPFLLYPNDVHSYFYKGSDTGSHSGAAEFNRTSLYYPKGSPNARNYAYLQNKAKPWEFFYLPDKFKLARRDTAPFLPQMSMRIATPDGSIENAEVTVEYIVKPWIDFARLAAASDDLKRMIPAGASWTEPELMPLHAKASLNLRIPSGVVSSDENNVIDLANGFIHSLTLSLDGFHEIYTAAYSRNATNNLSGQILVETGLSARESVPVEICFADTQGEILSFEQVSDGDGTIAVLMRNDIESDIRLQSLPIWVRQSDKTVAADIEGICLPIELAPGCEVSFTVRPKEQLADGGTLDIIFDTNAVEVFPDPENILPLISDTSIPVNYIGQIKIMTMPGLLDNKDDPTNPIVKINVDFKGGSSLELTRVHLEDIADVRLPLMDLMLGRDVPCKYFYRQQIIWLNGAQTVIDWRESDFGHLVLPIYE